MKSEVKCTHPTLNRRPNVASPSTFVNTRRNPFMRMRQPCQADTRRHRLAKITQDLSDTRHVKNVPLRRPDHRHRALEQLSAP